MTTPGYIEGRESMYCVYSSLQLMMIMLQLASVSAENLTLYLSHCLEQHVLTASVLFTEDETAALDWKEDVSLCRVFAIKLDQLDVGLKSLRKLESITTSLCKPIISNVPAT